MSTQKEKNKKEVPLPEHATRRTGSVLRQKKKKRTIGRWCGGVISEGKEVAPDCPFFMRSICLLSNSGGKTEEREEKKEDGE